MMTAPLADAEAQALKKISDGQVSKTAPNWPNFIAVEKGFFRREGIELETVYVGNVANTVQQLVAGSFDVASSTFDTAVRAIANGGNAVMIGGVVTKYPYSIMAAANVTSAADMKGKRIILPFPKDLLTIVWNRWLTEKGMRPEDVEQTYTGATPNRLAALVSGAVHAALLTQPFDFRAEAQGYRKLIDIGAFGKEYGFLTVLARPQWLRDNPDTARGYLRALAAAVDWLYDPANRDEAIEILARETKLDPAIATQTYNYYVGDLQPFSRKLAIPDEIIRSTVKTLIELGDIKPDAATAKYVATCALSAALTRTLPLIPVHVRPSPDLRHRRLPAHARADARPDQAGRHRPHRAHAAARDDRLSVPGGLRVGGVGILAGDLLRHGRERQLPDGRAAGVSVPRVPAWLDLRARTIRRSKPPPISRARRSASRNGRRPPSPMCAAGCSTRPACRSPRSTGSRPASTMPAARR